MSSEEKLTKILDKMPTTAKITYCGPHRGSDKDMCFIVSWSEKGRGFGEYAFYQEDGQWKIDNEMDRKDTIKRVMSALIDSLQIGETWDDERDCNSAVRVMRSIPSP